MHMLSRKDLNFVSQSFVTATGEVQTKEEATVYVKELNLLVTVKLLEDHWPETTTHQRWQTNKVQHGKVRTNRCFLKGFCTISPCDCWHPPECQF